MYENGRRNRLSAICIFNRFFKQNQGRTRLQHIISTEVETLNFTFLFFGPSQTLLRFVFVQFAYQVGLPTSFGIVKFLF